MIQPGLPFSGEKPCVRPISPPSAEALELAQQLVDTLPADALGLFNPWKASCHDDRECNSPDAKLARLAAHLDCSPSFLLCGEAPGWLGARISGIAFTSERLLMEGAIPRIPPAPERLSTRRLPYSEPSATIVWKALHRLGIASSTILWNAIQLHPYRPGNLQSNRTPTPAEIALGEPGMRRLIEAFPEARVVAIGRKAEGLLADMSIPNVVSVRHPANGGATEFAAGLEALVSS